METTMGKVEVTAKIENLDDLYEARKGRIADTEVRSVEIADALIDTGATGFLMPKQLIAQLGLEPLRIRNARTVNGEMEIAVYRAVRLTIQGRDCISDVGEIADGLPVIVGQVPLELMDWVVDPRRRQLIGNPAHGGEYMHDAF
jgi:predicted aspartyl protease